MGGAMQQADSRCDVGLVVCLQCGMGLAAVVFDQVVSVAGCGCFACAMAVVFALWLPFVPLLWSRPLNG